MQDFKSALEHQEKCHLIAKQVLPEDSEYLTNSKMQLNKFMQLSIAKEKQKVLEKGSREFGENPKQKPASQQQEDNIVKEQQKQKLSQIRAAMLAQNQYNKAYYALLDPGKQAFMEMMEHKWRTAQQAEQQTQEEGKKEAKPTKNKKKKNNK